MARHPSVQLSVMMNCDHIRWNFGEIITQLGILLASFLSHQKL